MTSVPSVGGEWESKNKRTPLSKQLSLHRPDSTTIGFHEVPSWRGRTRSRAFVDSCKEMSSVKETDERGPKSPGFFALSSLRDGGSAGCGSIMGGDVVGPFHAFPRLPPTAWFSSGCSCPTCHLTQELVTTQQIQNEALVKSLSRILSKLGGMDRSLDELDRYAAQLENADSEAALVASQKSRSSTLTSGRDGDEEDSPDVVVGMYPTAGGAHTTERSTIIAE